MVSGLLIVAAVMFGLYNVFIKLSADHIQAVLGAVVLQFVAALMGLALLLYIQRNALESLFVTTRGVVLAVCAGIAIGLVEILSFFIYGRGLEVAVGNPLIVGGSLIVTSGIGVYVLRESLTPLQVAAVVLIVAGVLLLAVGSARTGPA